jgi:hypothetical protein
MMKFVIALVIVAAVVFGGLLALRRSSRDALPSQDVIDRAKARERELQARERDDQER